MSQLHRGFQVRQYKPWKLWAGFTLLVLMLSGFFMLGSSYQAYELSRLKLENETLRSRIGELESRNLNLVRKNAQLAGNSRIERDAYQLANQELVKLQKQLLEQEEELVFYQGIVSPKDAAFGINLQSLEVKQGNKDHHYSYKVVLTKRGEGTKKITGTLDMLIRGEGKNDAVELLLSEVDLDKSEKNTKFSFRYFQVFEGELAFPEDFVPYEIEVSVASSTKKVKSFTETISWARVLSEDS